MKITEGVGEGKQGTLVTLRAKSSACKDTKNAVNNFGPEFIRVDNWPNPEFCNWFSPDKTLFRVVDPKGWAGWLPNSEIEEI